MSSMRYISYVNVKQTRGKFNFNWLSVHQLYEDAVSDLIDVDLVKTMDWAQTNFVKWVFSILLNNLVEQVVQPSQELSIHFSRADWMIFPNIFVETKPSILFHRISRLWNRHCIIGKFGCVGTVRIDNRATTNTLSKDCWNMWKTYC